MTSSDRSDSILTSQWIHWLVFLCLAFLLIFAPVVRGSNRQIALAVLLPIGLVVLSALAASFSSGRGNNSSKAETSRQRAKAIRPVLWWCGLLTVAFSPLWIAVGQMIPVTTSEWGTLAGRAPYLSALAALELELPDALAISLHPSATYAAAWSSVPVIAAFLSPVFLSTKAVERLLKLLLASAVVQAALALLQLVQGPTSLFYFDSAYNSGVIGSFNNRNHLADFLAMLLPVWFYFFIGSNARDRAASSYRDRQPLIASKPISLFVGFSLLVMLLVTQSRGGIIAGTIGMGLSVLVFLITSGKRLSTKQRLAAVSASLIFVVFAFLAVGFDGLAKRLEGVQLQTDAQIREAYALSALEAAHTFWPWGSGLGSFEAVFPRFQASDTPGYINHAHNDYAQMLMEAGAAAVVVGALLGALVALQVVALRRRHSGGSGRSLPSAVALRCYAGLGAITLLLHSWVEYNMRIPALAITAAFLMGVFLKPVATSRRESDPAPAAD